MRTSQKPEPERFYYDVVRILMVNDDWVTTDYLARLLDISIGDTRTLLAKMREDGFPILGRKHRGIKLAKTDSELANYIDRLEKEIETRMSAIDALTRIMREGVEK